MPGRIFFKEGEPLVVGFDINSIIRDKRLRDSVTGGRVWLTDHLGQQDYKPRTILYFADRNPHYGRICDISPGESKTAEELRLDPNFVVRIECDPPKVYLDRMRKNKYKKLADKYEKSLVSK